VVVIFYFLAHEGPSIAGGKTHPMHEVPRAEFMFHFVHQSANTMAVQVTGS